MKFLKHQRCTRLLHILYSAFTITMSFDPLGDSQIEKAAPQDLEKKDKIKGYEVQDIGVRACNYSIW